MVIPTWYELIYIGLSEVETLSSQCVTYMKLRSEEVSQPDLSDVQVNNMRNMSVDMSGQKDDPPFNILKLSFYT